MVGSMTSRRIVPLVAVTLVAAYFVVDHLYTRQKHLTGVPSASAVSLARTRTLEVLQASALLSAAQSVRSSVVRQSAAGPVGSFGGADSGTELSRTHSSEIIP